MGRLVGKQQAKQAYTDTWLTPPELIKNLGPFTTDPCCPPSMPWQTAKYTWTKEDNGLAMPWRAGSRSSETRWAQLLMRGADLLVFPPFRFDFCRADGTPSGKTWQPSMLTAIGKTNESKLYKWAKKNACVILKEID